MNSFSIIQKSQLEGSLRLDSEYYQPEYLNIVNKLLKTRSCKYWENIDGRFITGPFGSEFNVENYVTNGKYRYVRGKDVKEFFLQDNDNVYIPKSDFERLDKYSLHVGDILISVVGTIGNSSFVNNSVIPAIFSCKSTVFRSKTINPYFFITYLNSYYGKSLLLRNGRGHVQIGLNIDDLKNLPVFVPSVIFQKEIENVIRSSIEEQNKSYLFYSQAENLFLEELGLKDYQIEDDLSWTVNLSEAKKANRIDADYFQPKFDRLLKNLNNTQPLKSLGNRKTTLIEIEPDKEYSYIEISDVNTSNSEVRFNNVKGSELPVNAKLDISGGELIVSKVRPTRGAVAIVPDNWNNSYVASGAFSVFQITSPGREYLQVVLRSFIGRLQMEKPTTGTSYPTITDEDVENIKIPIISASTQQKIADLVKKSHEARKKSKALLEEAKRKVEEMIEKGGGKNG